MKTYPLPDPDAPISKVEELEPTYSGYTYAQYLQWKFEDMVEIIKGRVFPMSAPREIHQRITGNLYRDIAYSMKKHPCRVYIAPFDVRLPLHGKKDVEITTVVQPDICVICDLSKIDKKGCLGAPDMIIEVLSPSTSKKDMRNKI